MADAAKTVLPRLTLRRSVVMVGMMGAGKTAVGRALAETLAVPFRDSDEEIERAANMTIPEIFAQHGETFFREKESLVVSRLLTGEPAILSTGGGAFMQARNREAIARHGVSLWLDADIDLLWDRVRHRDTRPLLRTADPYATLAAMHAERVPVYAQATLRVTSRAGMSIAQTVARVVAALADHADTLERTDG